MTIAERIGTAPLDPADAARPRWLTLAELLTNYEPLPKAELGGFLRNYYAGLRASFAEQGLIYVPVGQGAPRHSIRCEHLITVLEGEVEFVVGEERILLERLGQIFIPADTKYEFRNVGMVDVWFHNVLARVDEWPAPADYPA